MLFFYVFHFKVFYYSFQQHYHSTLLHLTPLQIVKSFKHEDETGHFVQCIRFVEKLSFFKVSDSLCDTI